MANLILVRHGWSHEQVLRRVADTAEPIVDSIANRGFIALKPKENSRKAAAMV